MASSASEDDIMDEISKIKKKLKKLTRRRRRKNRVRRDSKSRSRSRLRSSSPKESSPPVITINSSPLNNTEEQQKQNDDPVTITNESLEVATIPEALLVALGDDKPGEERYGPDINSLISSRWEKILLQDSEEIKDILKAYKIPTNCPLLEAPELNPEVKAALTDSARNRDQMLQNKQQQLGIAMACLGQAMTKILGGQEVSESLRLLSDGTKLLSSLHYHETITRKQLIAPLLDKSFTKMAESITRNRYLFGENLAEKIKNNKFIEQSGLQLRKPKTATFNRSGNWTGPSRQQTQKNTVRGGQKRAPVQPQAKKTYPVHKKVIKRGTVNHPERDYQRVRQRR